MTKDIEVEGARIRLPDKHEIKIDGKHLIYKEYFEKDEEMNVNMTISLLNKVFELMKKQGQVENYKVSTEEGDEIEIMLDIEYSNKKYLYDGLIYEFLPQSNIGESTLVDILIRQGVQIND